MQNAPPPIHNAPHYNKIVSNYLLGQPPPSASFPQTSEIRSLRRSYKQGTIDLATYEQGLQQEIAYAVAEQEQVGLDVLGAWRT